MKNAPLTGFRTIASAHRIFSWFSTHGKSEIAKKTRLRVARTLLFCLTVLHLPYHQASACTRIVYNYPEKPDAKNKTVLTARTFDWEENLPVSLWIFPRDITRDLHGLTDPNGLKWTSKYGSVITSVYNIATCDGMNEKGLVANILWLSESKYPEKSNSKPDLPVSAWAQYILDNFATVAEAVDKLQDEPFTVYLVSALGEHATVHLSVSDATGDSAIFEYIGGKLVIHHSDKYQVMTNSPIYDQQIALNKYWEEIGGFVMLPGTNRAADRFVRASFYIKAIPQTDDERMSVASVFSVIRNASVPLGIKTKEKNISSTQWLTVADQKHMKYYFQHNLIPNIFWVDFSKLDFSAKEPKEFTLPINFDPDKNDVYNKLYLGDVSKSFKNRKTPFAFLKAEPLPK